jgi:hypothetical protein
MFLGAFVIFLGAILAFLPTASAFASTDNSGYDFTVEWVFGDEEILTEIFRIVHVDGNGNANVDARSGFTYAEGFAYPMGVTSSQGFIYHDEYSNLILTLEVFYLDALGEIVVEQHFVGEELIYGRSVGIMPLRAIPHRVERHHTWPSGNRQTHHASGNFTINANRVTVSNPGGGITSVPNVTTSNPSTTTFTGHDLIGYRATVRFSVTVRGLDGWGTPSTRTVDAIVWAHGGTNN